MLNHQYTLVNRFLTDAALQLLTPVNEGMDNFF
jgi:hypothetical protein